MSFIKFKNISRLLIVVCIILSFTFVEARDYPKRIVSLGPAITEGLFLLGYGDNIVGVTTYCIRPPDAQRKVKVGGVTNISVEKITSLNPDLIIATPLTDIRAIEKLKSLGYGVVTFPLAKDFDDVTSQFITLGKIINRQLEAEHIVKVSQKRLQKLKKGVAPLKKPKVFVQIGSRPLFTITKDSFVNDMLISAGGINIAQDAPSGIYSREKVVEQNPDVIIIMDMGIVTEEEKEIWMKYKTIKAVSSQRIYKMDSYKFGSPTPLTFVETVEELIKILHGKTTN
ncbi:MAG: ABC transporter substrate-binding protein [Thermodesulfovibrionales bacterium]|nr:ABC transporter substrate-binding protein [Thermodesulfovibrionales bacterium]